MGYLLANENILGLTVVGCYSEGDKSYRGTDLLTGEPSQRRVDVLVKLQKKRMVPFVLKSRNLYSIEKIISSRTKDTVLTTLFSLEKLTAGERVVLQGL